LDVPLFALHASCHLNFCSRFYGLTRFSGISVQYLINQLLMLAKQMVKVFPCWLVMGFFFPVCRSFSLLVSFLVRTLFMLYYKVGYNYCATLVPFVNGCKHLRESCLYWFTPHFFLWWMLGLSFLFLMFCYFILLMNSF
jgi:hypothetical protein